MHNDSSHLTPGRKPVLELLSLSPERIDTVFIADDMAGLGNIVALCKDCSARFRKVPRRDLDRLFTGNHQGVIARLRARTLVTLDHLLTQARHAPFPLLLALDHVQDPGNVGTLARTLYALGGAGLLFPQDRTAFLGQTAAKAAAGALDRMPLCQVVNLSRALDACDQAGFVLYGSGTGEGSHPLYSTALRVPAVLVLGNEEKGLRPNVRKRCTEILSIPMHNNFNSLNVAQAGAILMGEMLRQCGITPR